jgi:tripartite-type tricarboxylate transporter receptor subunit TctC
MSTIREGKIKAVFITGAKRMSQLPNVPTIQESGVAGYDVNAWVGLMVPAGTPDPVVQRLNREIASIINSPEIKTRLSNDGSEVVASSPEAFASHIRRELVKWGTVIRNAGIKAE